MSAPEDDNEITQRLAAEFEQNAEWQAYRARVTRCLLKRNGGKGLNKEEAAIVADYKVAASLLTPPKHHITGEQLPPVLYGYNEAAEAFGVTRNQLYGLRANRSQAFVGNLILTATLALELKTNPEPEPVPLNLVHTGAKGKFSKELAASIVKCLKFSPILSVVARAHGIEPATLTIWRQKGEAGDKKYADFFKQTEAAIGSSQMRLLRNIAQTDDWKAQAKILEFTDQARFGRQSRLEHTGKNGGPIKTDGPPPIQIVLEGVGANPYDPTAEPIEDEDDEDGEGEG